MWSTPAMWPSRAGRGPALADWPRRRSAPSGVPGRVRVAAWRQRHPWRPASSRQRGRGSPSRKCGQPSERPKNQPPCAPGAAATHPVNGSATRLPSIFYVLLAKAHDTPLPLLNQRSDLVAACVQIAASAIIAAAAASMNATTGRSLGTRGSAASASATRAGRPGRGRAAECGERRACGWASAAIERVSGHRRSTPGPSGHERLGRPPGPRHRHRPRNGANARARLGERPEQPNPRRRRVEAPRRNLDRRGRGCGPGCFAWRGWRLLRSRSGGGRRRR